MLIEKLGKDYWTYWKKKKRVPASTLLIRSYLSPVSLACFSV